MRIQRVKHDHPALRALHQLTLPSDAEPHWGSGWWWLVWADEGIAPVAFAGCQPSQRWGDAMYLCRSGVHQAFRGKGLQRRLISVRERLARRLGMRWVITSTHENPASANSLIACGFRMYEPNKPWGAKGTLYWRKEIA
jgi:GNAT superfamily N-acetyltransferase